MNDPIVDHTPAKRRKLNPNNDWDSGNSSDNFNDGDFEPATIATVPVSKQQPAHHVTQATQPMPRSPEVQVDRSSPVLLSSPKRPDPIKRAPFARPGLLASTIAPPGTSFRAPSGIKRTPVVIDVDSDDDPPVQHSDDEETQLEGLRSSLKPTNFQRGGRGLDSSPNVVKQSPDTSRLGTSAGSGTPFMSLLSEVSKPSTTRSADDMASAYGSSSRNPRPFPQRPTTNPQQGSNTPVYRTLDDIIETKTRDKVAQMLAILGNNVPVQRCADALRLKHGHVQDAMEWLGDQDEAEISVDELAYSPPKKGVAKPRFEEFKFQPSRPAAKQEVKAPARTIAEKYGSTQRAANSSQTEPDVTKPKRRLVQGRKAASRSTPPSSPAKPPSPSPPVIQIDSDSEAPESEGKEQHGDAKLLDFLNDCSAKDLSELCGQPEDTAIYVLDQRPFRNLDQVREISMTGVTKSGKKSRARAIGQKVVDDCLEMFRGYNAVDDLVKQCEKIALPLKRALQGWGVGNSKSNGDADGELHLTNLDEAHDSGIGTPTSSCSPDEIPSKKKKGKFISQPENMSPDITLKDYQLVGVNWLNLLYEKRLSCILADDMGLGKTCQIIAFLSYLQLQEVDGIHLIIVPGSTLENWLREFERFAPQLNVRPYYGAQKEREQLRYDLEEMSHELDVIVTTYDMAASKDDNKFLRKYGPYSVCVYDEAHALRNPKSNRYQQLVRIGADFKVLLTGTPLQNNLQELIAILAFIMPELFQDKREDLEVIFKHKATTNDATHAALLSAERVARARSMMTPFILRRKKEQVLDLPAKHRRVEYCDMTPSQAEFYAEVLGEARQFYSQKAAGNKSGQSSNVLMSLRKVAIHPLLSRRIFEPKIEKIVTALSKSDEFGGNSIDKIRAYITGDAGISLQGGDYALHHFCAQREGLKKYALKRREWMDSGKVEIFKSLVTRFAANGDRLLVFSQFTTVMDILEAVLETLEIKFMRLDGSTKMEIRQDMIDQFMTDLSIPVFMLSTKAGGAGINLAAANKVIIFDSGFNPQDDMQAENRAHRVGQTREVEVIRLVTRGTIEEQIHALGESKLALDERVAGDGATEKAGEQLVQQMLVEKLQDGDGSGDMKDAFKKGLEQQGLKVMSKQAQF